MKIVYKYKMPDPGKMQELDLPNGFITRHIAITDEGIMMWAEVDPDWFTREVEFITVGTGWSISDKYVYVGTVIQSGFVWHTFYRIIE